ncbi:MAG: thioredoxin domain-containing protein [Bacteroidota bacterium]|nr:MAG: thioredoxin domain-containing protein [Bacteroidota bacterium]
MANKPRFTNSLILETSPYLLQHAHNPVQWKSWGEEALQQAKLENKLLVISIGYSACHWCHVMEHESFEDLEVAELMNQYFVSIKVDREERPDVDNVYMNAIHLMGQRGGWPLNAVALPDGRPIYAATYLPKSQWINLLSQLHEIHTNQPGRLEEYAINLTNGLEEQKNQLILSSENKLNPDLLNEIVSQWTRYFDFEWGGHKGAPKFVLPNALSFLLKYNLFVQNEPIKAYLETSLDAIAAGGIYDHLAGGFARYSTDAEWKVPHFEKMLYDNAQLIALYSEAYQIYKKPRYRQVVNETTHFLINELAASTGGFYAAIDADSENMEGRYYVWTWQELEAALGEKLTKFASTYKLSEEGNWEHGYNVLHTELNVETQTPFLAECFEILLDARKHRPRPATDTKVMTSWNALLVSSLAKAYIVFRDDMYLHTSLSLADFLLENMTADANEVFRIRTSDKQIAGFLDDYSLLAQSLIDLYSASFEEKYLWHARGITEKMCTLFFDTETGFFRYAGQQSESLFSSNFETSDNVIPSSNSVAAHVLHELGIYFNRPDWIELSSRMLEKLTDNLAAQGPYYSNWGILALKKLFSWPEVIITGPDAIIRAQQFEELQNNILVAASQKNSQLPIMKDRFVEGKSLIYVCHQQSCLLPVESVEEALRQLKP